MSSKQNQLTGILWMILHCFLISSVVTIAKFLGKNNYGEGQIVFFHSFVAFIILLPFAIHFEGKKLLKTKLFNLHLLRGILGNYFTIFIFLRLKIYSLNGR